MASKFETFAALHVPGDPVILYNIWDVGSALAVVAAGAKALATGSHPVADANGWPDGQKVPIDFALANARRIVEAVEVPLTVDFESAYSDDAERGAANVAELKATGAVGCNFEDQVIGGEGLHPLEQQVNRIAAMRRAVGDDFYINARTDLFLKTLINGWQVSAKALNNVPEMTIQNIFPWCFTPELYAERPDYIQSLSDFVRSRPAETVVDFILQSNAVIAHDVEEQLINITAPTQISFGSLDMVTSTRFAFPMQERIRNTELIIFDRCAHAPNFERVDEFNQRTLEFLQRQQTLGVGAS